MRTLVLKQPPVQKNLHPKQLDEVKYMIFLLEVKEVWTRLTPLLAKSLFERRHLVSATEIAVVIMTVTVSATVTVTVTVTVIDLAPVSFPRAALTQTPPQIGVVMIVAQEIDLTTVIVNTKHLVPAVDHDHDHFLLPVLALTPALARLHVRLKSPTFHFASALFLLLPLLLVLWKVLAQRVTRLQTKRPPSVLFLLFLEPRLLQTHGFC